jgi:hypothetical protein
VSGGGGIRTLDTPLRGIPGEAYAWVQVSTEFRLSMRNFGPAYLPGPTRMNLHWCTVGVNGVGAVGQRDYGLVDCSLGCDLLQGAFVVTPHASGVPAAGPVGVCSVPLGGDFAAVGASATMIDPVGDEAQELKVLVAWPPPSLELLTAVTLVHPSSEPELSGVGMSDQTATAMEAALS